MSKPLQARSIATLEKILVAAEAVVVREGVGGLTMDGVAQEAGLSKGGVLHHFRAKEALIAKLASRKLDALRQDLDRSVCERTGDPRQALRAMIDQADATYGRDDSFSLAMLVAAVENSQSLEQFRSLFAETFDRVRAESADPDAAATLLFAVIGLQVSRTLGFAELDRIQAEALFHAMRRMSSALPAREGASTGSAAPPPPKRGDLA